MSPRTRANLKAKTPLANRLQLLFEGEIFLKISKKLAVSQATCRAYMAGDTEPTASVLASICLCTGCDANWLLLGKGEPFPDEN
jgi:hypothetical protein